MVETMNIYAPKGTKVKYINRNGYDLHREWANKFLNENQVYTVDFTDVGGWKTYVYLEEVPDKGFNSVMFVEV